MMTDTNANERLVKIIDAKIDSKSLFENSNEIIITHNKNEYKLKITQTDKLILTK
jgi:hemin uptake protein HemP